MSETESAAQRLALERIRTPDSQIRSLGSAIENIEVCYRKQTHKASLLPLFGSEAMDPVTEWRTRQKARKAEPD
jgi:hypothetical protein